MRNNTRPKIQSLIIHVYWTNVIANNVKHDEHVSGVASLNQRLKVRFAAKVGVETVKILHPVTVIAVGSVCNHWGNPYSVEPHT